MADMATYDQVEQCWDDLVEAGVADSVVPVSYMNSSAAIKGFTGRHGGTICTSSNAKSAMQWAFDQGPDRKVLFIPDQHLGRNTAVLELGLSLDDCVVYNPHKPGGGLHPRAVPRSQGDPVEGPLLGPRALQRPDRRQTCASGSPASTCSCTPSASTRSSWPPTSSGSTDFIIKTLDAAEPGSAWAIGTELNLVKRMAQQHPDKQIVFLDKTVCFCSTMNRIDLPHLVWALEQLVAGEVPNRITVEPETARWAKQALDQMLALP